MAAKPFWFTLQLYVERGGTIMVPEINVWAVLVATLSTMIVGSIWYTPKVFGNYWMRVAKVDSSGDGKSAIVPIIVTLVSVSSAPGCWPELPLSPRTSTAAASCLIR